MIGPERHAALSAWAFLAPALLLIAVFFFLPVLAALLLSFTDFDIYALGDLDRLRFVGFANYLQLLQSPLFWTALGNTFYFVVVGGPLCESGDIFTQEEGGYVSTRSLPTAAIGDYLTIECAGAYGFVMGSNYNSKPLAAEVLIRDRRPYLIRQRQTAEDLMRGERIPPAA